MDFLSIDSLPAKKMKRDFEHKIGPGLTEALGELLLELSKCGMLGKSTKADTMVYRITKKFGDEILHKSTLYFMEHKTASEDIPEIMFFLTAVIDYFEFILRSKFSRPPYDGWSSPLERVIDELRKQAKDEAEILLPGYTPTNIGVTLGDCRVANGSLDFMNDPRLKLIVERDISELNDSIKANSIKSVLILSGSVLEGLLLDALMAIHDRVKAKYTDGKIENWTLEKIIGAANEFDILPNKTLEKFTHGVKDYRNLAHPGKEIRDNMQVAPEEARIVIDIVNIILRTFRAN